MDSTVFLFFNLGGGEIIVVLLVVLLFFGSSKIPELARGLGKGIREFKDATSGVQREIEKGMRDVERPIREAEKSIRNTGEEAKKEDS